MTIRNEIESFIGGIYSGKTQSLPKGAIIEMAQEAYLAPIIVDLLGFMPPEEYDEESFVTAINAIIRGRKIEDLTGGLVRMPARVP